MLCTKKSHGVHNNPTMQKIMMDHKKPACQTAEMAIHPSSIDADKGDSGCSSGEGIILLMFEDGVVLEKKTSTSGTKPSGTMAEATHPSSISVELVGIEQGDHGCLCLCEGTPCVR